MQATSPTFYGTVTLNGNIVCAPTVGRKIDIYNSGATIYGFGLNDFEYCIFGGEGSALTYRIARAGASDLAGDIALFVNATGLGLPAGNPISWDSNTLIVDAAGALLVNGAPVSGGGAGGYNPAAVAITGGTINGTAVGATTPAAVTGTTLAATAGSIGADAGTGTGVTLNLLTRGGASGGDVSINLLTASSGPGASLGAATSKGWTFVARGDGNTFGQANYLIWSYWSGTTWNEYFRLLPDGPLQLSSLYTAAATGGSKGAGTVNATALFVNGVSAVDGTPIGTTTPAAGRFSTLFSAAVDLEGGTIDNTPIGATTANTGRFTTLALTGSQTSKFVLIAPNATNGAPTWRQILSTDVSGLGTFATANTATPPAIGDTTANTGRFTTLTHTGFLLRSMATGLTASTTNTQAGALGLTASVNNITTAAPNSAVRLPNAAPATNTAAETIVRNGGANAVNVFPVSGAAINALAANAAYSLAAGASVRFMQLSSTLYVTA